MAEAVKKPRILLDKRLFCDNIDKFCKHFKVSTGVLRNGFVAKPGQNLFASQNVCVGRISLRRFAPAADVDFP
jgi:hypothetical protein